MKTLNKLLIATLFVFLFSLDFQCVNAQSAEIITIQGNSDVYCGQPETYEVVFGPGIPFENTKGIVTDKKILTENTKSNEVAGPPETQYPTYEWSITGGTILEGNHGPFVTVQFESSDCSLSCEVKYLEQTYIATQITSIDINFIQVNPSAAGIITGSGNVCSGTNGVIYSIPVITDATGYVWSLPSGASIVSGSNTNSITVNYSASSTSGIISVYGTNCEQNGTASSKLVTISALPSPAGVITGNSIACPGSNGVDYSISPISGATGYVWTLPSGVSIASGNNTNSIKVNFSSSAVSGNISVYGTNSCGNGNSSSIQVSIGSPASAGIITGKNFVSPGSNGVTYSIASITGASGYIWEVPNGATITSGANTNSIMVNYLSTATSGTIKVTPINGCGSGTPSNITVTVGDITTAGAITINPTIATNNYLLFKTDVTNLGVIGSDAKINTSGNANNLGMSVYGNNNLEFSTNSAKRFIINGSGNVGIGTTTPATKFQVKAGTNINLGIRDGQTDVTAIQLNAFNDAADTNIPMELKASKYNFTIGNVGIGTINPTYKLEVNGGISTNAPCNFVHSSNEVTLINGYTRGDLWLNYRGSSVKLNYSLGSGLGNGTFGNLQLDNLFTTGNVGVGTTTPSEKVTVNGGVSIEGSNSISSVNGFSNSLQLKNASNAAIVFNPGQSTELMFGFHSDGNFYWGTGQNAGNSYCMFLSKTGNLGITGKLTTSEVNVKIGGWADFVFHPSYKLRTLGEIEQFIKANNHLPEIPTESEVKQNGIGLGEMNAKLLQKIEELTLYMIEQNNKMDEQQKVNEKQNQLINELERKLEAIANKK